MFSTLALVRPEQLRRLMARRLMVERPLMSSPPPWNSATAGRDDSDELDVAGDSVGEAEAEADPNDDDAAGCGERENKRFQKPGDDDCCAIGVCGAGDDANEYGLLVDIVAVVDNDDDGEAVSGKASAPDEAGLDAAEENEGEADAAKEKSEEAEAAAAVVMKGKEAGKSGRRSASVSDAAWDRSSAVSWKQWLDTAARVRLESVAQRERSSDRTSGSTNLSCRVVACRVTPAHQCNVA
jgi:hypothetical protein